MNGVFSRDDLDDLMRHWSAEVRIGKLDEESYSGRLPQTTESKSGISQFFKLNLEGNKAAVQVALDVSGRS